MHSLALGLVFSLPRTLIPRSPGRFAAPVPLHYPQAAWPLGAVAGGRGKPRDHSSVRLGSSGRPLGGRDKESWGDGSSVVPRSDPAADRAKPPSS